MKERELGRGQFYYLYYSWMTYGCKSCVCGSTSVRGWFSEQQELASNHDQSYAKGPLFFRCSQWLKDWAVGYSHWLQWE